VGTTALYTSGTGGFESTATNDVCDDEIEYVFPSRRILALTVRDRRAVSSGFARACCPSSRPLDDLARSVAVDRGRCSRCVLEVTEGDRDGELGLGAVGGGSKDGDCIWDGFTWTMVGCKWGERR
jgi:hypothetical protein